MWVVIKFRMVQSHEGGIGTVEECKLKPGLGAQIGETIFIENFGSETPSFYDGFISFFKSDDRLS